MTPEARKLAGKKWRDKNPDYFRTWARANAPRLLESRRVSKANLLARKVGAEATLTLEEWHTVLDRFNHLCAYCLGPYDQLDHVVPRGDGGGSTRENVVPACKDCNLRKGRTVRIAKTKSTWVPSLASEFWPHLPEEMYA